MNVTCPECRTVFRVDPDRVPDPGVRARCSVCGGIITIAAERAWADDFAEAPRSTTQPVEPSPYAPEPSPYAGAGESPEAGTTPSAAEPREEAAHSDAAPDEGATEIAMPEAAPEPVVAEQTSSEPAVREAPSSEPPTAPAPSVPSVPRAPIAAGRMARPTPPRVPPFSPARRMAPPAVAQPRGPIAVHRGAPDASRAAAQPATESERVATASEPARASVPAPASTTPVPTPDQMSMPASGAERRPINPFLANDPNAKARRLARALVSDMIAYHPQKREDGLRAGTLKQLFRDEIRKSYEEYVEQVGPEFAESTSHFQDALNDVLAGGKKIF